ncbi:A24 family peptidase [Hydrogenophaga sp. PBL-H3]|uniref:A24 family peptidase n=1 Tax=Hydrogenophaga sp. PBL-H3 TaxID=434010 RepID=UPI00131F8AA6|nr:prepilin peptidase [Hydrogenophaga sp. PBL-H3]QHE76503.1 hypothetical protein F9Z45_10755 [Hydrogenophaga sp. PBL-H3]QHE80927.1 hypothetical protein F9Z44_10755 [Hydrogenophaga sp. PBL-H3]
MNVQLQIQVSSWQLIASCILAIALLVAIAFDARARRIPNFLVLTVLIAGLLLNAVGPQPFRVNDGLFSLTPGALGFAGSLLGGLVALMAFLPMYALRALGAGDVKLLAGVGAFAGTAAFLNIALWVLLAGGVLALARMAVVGHPRLLLNNMAAVMTGQFKPAQTLWRMPYAVAIAMGVAAHAAWVFSGRTPILNF